MHIYARELYQGTYGTYVEVFTTLIIQPVDTQPNNTKKSLIDRNNQVSVLLLPYIIDDDPPLISCPSRYTNLRGMSHKTLSLHLRRNMPGRSNLFWSFLVSENSGIFV